MTTGATGTYAINDVNICPEAGRWLPKPAVGIDGNGHSIYPALKDFEMTWGLISVSDFSILHQAYLTVSNTGTVAVDLPEWGATQHVFRRYSGAILHEPQTGEYLSDYITDVRLLITGIRTT